MITFNMTLNYRTKLQKELIEKIKYPATMKEMNEIILAYANEYVPTKSGNLVASSEATPDSIRWSTPYARYQYLGKVYGPNLLGWVTNSEPGWRSPSTKYPTSRELGAKNESHLMPAQFVSIRDADGNIKGYTKAPPGTPEILASFGYTKPNTHHHWMRAMWAERKRALQNEITWFLKDKVSRSGHRARTKVSRVRKRQLSRW